MTRTAWIVMVGLTLLNMRSYGQQVSFSGSAVKLESFFSSVSKQTGYVFFYNASQLNNAQPLSIHLKNASVDSALRVVLKNQPFSFDILGKTIFINHAHLVLPVPSAAVPSGVKRISGQVIDASGLPVIGATVYALSLKTSVETNENGDFQIRIKEGDSLIVSSVSFTTQTVKPDSHYIKVILQFNTSPLEQVVIGGNLFAVKRKSDISSLTVIDRKTLESLPVTNIAEIFRGLVPGTNSYSVGDQSQDFPSLTIRGAADENSISQISVYVDGVEWAGGSGYLSALNKENIERIEILRGPESSTLYGTGSNGGIVQIFTRKGLVNSSMLSVTAGAGFIQSKWMHASAFQQYYTVSKQMSFKNIRIIAGGTYQTNGAWLPGGGEKTGTAILSLKWEPIKKLSFDVTGYYAGTNRGVSRSPVYDTCTHLPDTLMNFGVYPRKLTNKEAEIRSYFGGLNLVYRPTSYWSHQITFGYSQNDNHELSLKSPDKNGRMPDNFFQSLSKTTTLRYSNILNLGKPDQGLAVSFLSGAEYKNIFYSSQVTGSRPYIRNDDPSNTNVGIFAQASPSYKNIYLTAGLRYDYNKLFENNHSLNPRIGLTTNFSFYGLTIKPRISWGSGITAPSYEARYGSPSDGYVMVLGNASIKPQQQSGFDYGLEIYDRQNLFSGEVVYYDNTLKNMFVENQVLDDPNGLAAFQYTNAGTIANRGWEFSAKYILSKRLSVYVSFSIMQSVIKDSTGDYQSFQLAGRAPGYQLKNLPRHTTGLFMTYQFFRLFGKKDKGSLSLNVTEVDGVYGLDAVKYSIDAAYGRAPVFSGSFPDMYWVTNGTIFKLGFNVEYFITKEIGFFAQGSNILNQNNYEQNSNFPTHGANWLFGFKFSSGK